MRNTKVESLLKQIESGNLKTNTARVLQLIQKGRKNKKELMMWTALSHQTITSRLSDLQDMGLIEVVGEEEINVYKYQPDQVKQIQNAQDRKYSKFKKWKERGRTEFAEFLKEPQLKMNL